MGSVVFPDVDILDDSMEAQQVLQGSLNQRRARETTHASGKGASSQSPQYKKPKRRNFSSIGTQGKKSTELTTVIVVLDEEGEASDKGASLQRIIRSSSAKHDA